MHKHRLKLLNVTMVKQDSMLILTVLKVGSALLYIMLCVFQFSCNQYRNNPTSISGTWIAIDDNSTTVRIDTIQKLLTLDFTKLGGRKFQSSYSSKKNNEIESSILPLGGKFEIDREGLLKIYPIIQIYQKDIEVIYVYKFKKM